MDINENIRNKRKLVENLRGFTHKITLHQLITIIYYNTWYQIKFEK